MLYALTARVRVTLCSATVLICVPPLAMPPHPVTVRHDGYGTTDDTLVMPTGDAAVTLEAQTALPLQSSSFSALPVIVTSEKHE